MKLIFSISAGIAASASMVSAAGILLVTNNDTTSQSLNDFLTNEGHTVTRDARAAGPLAGDATAFDLVIIARETNSGDYDDGTEPADWQALAAPIIIMAPHIVRNNRLGFADGIGLATTNAATDYDAYPDNSHPLLGGVTSTAFQVSPSTFATRTTSNALPAGSTVVATLGGNPTVWVTPAGSSMFNPGGPTAAGDVRIGFMRGEEGAWDNISSDGEQILRNILSVYDPNSGDDADNDGLIDTFEMLIISADPDDAITTIEHVLPGDDFDMDNLTNEEEFAQDPRTNPANPDTDDDSINDGAEVDGSGNTFDGTPTSPSRADTDGDEIDDMDEMTGDNGAITNPNDDDSDDDTMLDGFELANMLDPNTDDGALDPDNDMSTNVNEFVVGTDPQVSDTDDDGYIDGIETNDGSFDDIATDTGTDPLSPDTDGDRLKDGAETNTGVFVDADDTGTSPLTADTDFDNFRDGAEVLFHGTNPNLDTSVPNGLAVYFVGGTAGISGPDRPAITFLEDKYGITNISYAQALAASAGDEVGSDLVVVSSTILSGDGRNKFHTSTLPVVHWEQLLNRGAAGEFGLTGGMTTGDDQTSMINLVEHPITADLPSPMTLWAPGSSLVYYSNSVGEEITTIATAVDGTAIDNPLFMVADEGDALAFGTGAPGDIAPARRVFLPFDNNSFQVLSEDGFQLVGRALDWAVGRLDEGIPPLAITDVIYDATTVPEDVSVSLTFNSKLNQNYAIYATDDLSVPLLDRADINDSYPGEEGSTTFSFNYSDIGFDVSIPKLFFVVIEVE